MSLKAFHIVFVIASILLGLGVGAWGVIEYSAKGELGALIMGIIFLIMGIALMVYGRRMLKKTKHIGYLTVTGLFLTQQNAAACATCYGESDSPMAEGMNAGIFVLLIVVTCMLSGLGAFFIFLARRAKTAAAREKILKNPDLIGVKEIDLSKPSREPKQIF